MELEVLRGLSRPADSKVVLLVLDGLGGLPRDAAGKTELETATTPHLDALARSGICGLHLPVGEGITPGSGPGHLGLFGYDPVRYEVGRGVLSALGIGFALRSEDVVARGNFCTVDDQGRITDRRAGRIATEQCRELCAQLSEISLPDTELYVEPIKEHRFLLALRGAELGAEIRDTDPQRTGVEPAAAEAETQTAEKTAALVNRFVSAARQVLAKQQPANMVLLRGFSKRPDWPSIPDVYGIRAAALAAYPMYRGVAALVGMDVLACDGDLAAILETLPQNWDRYDYFFLHVKPTDSAGEDGDFDRRVRLIEEIDGHIPRLQELHPEVLIVTGDHSTPARLAAHSWHPVPVLLTAETCRPDGVSEFGERACLAGGLGPRFRTADLMPLAQAHAGRVGKYGA